MYNKGRPFNSWGGEGVDFWSASFCFLATLLNALQDVFFSLLHFSARFLLPQKSVVFTFTECIYIYIVVIAAIVLIWI